MLPIAITPVNVVIIIIPGIIRNAGVIIAVVIIIIIIIIIKIIKIIISLKIKNIRYYYLR